MDKLGINLESFLFQVINFGILFFILGKFVYPKFLEMLDERKEKIQQGLENSAKIDTELKSIEEKKEKELVKTQEETLSIIKKAREEAQKTKKAIEDDAKEKASTMMKQAEEEIEKKKEQMMKDFSHQAVDLALLAAKNIIKTEITQIDKNTLLNQSLEELKKA